MRKKILVTGSFAYDHIMYHDGVFHEIVLPEHLHNLNVCFLIKEKNVHFGGTAGNIAYNLRLLGENTIVLGVAGKDFDEYKMWLQKHDIDTSHIKTNEETYTASAFITTDKKGNQITHFYPGAMESTPNFDLHVLKDEISLAIIAPDSLDRMMNIAEQCKKNEIPYLFDPGQRLPNFTKDELQKSIQGSLGIILNEYELELLLDKLKVPKKNLFDWTNFLLVTRGEKGSTIETLHEKEEIGIGKPSKIADPTGCGDAYRAGILMGLKNKFSRKKTGQIGALMGTYALEHIGTQNHRFTTKEFEIRYKENFGENF